MKTAQENISKLPTQCYGVLLIDKSIIVIKAGESGYFQTTQPPAHLISTSVEDFVNEINAENGVTIAQRKAMEIGSMIGWGNRGADPDNYDEQGKYIQETA